MTRGRIEWAYPVDGLGGTIPPELGNSTSLRFIGLHQNGIQGSIPKELGRMTKLSSLDLAVNRLTGSIPPELGNITVRRQSPDDKARIRHSLHDTSHSLERLRGDVSRSDASTPRNICYLALF